MFSFLSLFQVEPFAGIVDSCRIYIPRILFNREAVGPFKSKPRMNDVAVKGAQINQAFWKLSLTA